MSYGHDEGPVYYREIQKNAYLKRIPNDPGGSKLRPLGHKKPPLKPMWTMFCVHNGRSPYLEQYPLAECPATLAHKPIWRACLRTARHVTASVKPHSGSEYDFLIDTDHGPVRMLAPDWGSMQDWVTTLRNKLHELRILSKGENVYCAAPAAPPPRAAARDPTSPLPPTPPVPPDRVPGIELTTPTTAVAATATRSEPEPEPESIVEPIAEPAIDISNWEDSTPSTSQETQEPRRIERDKDTKKSVAKICGQNICLDDSILKRNTSTDSDEEFFNEIDRISGSVENLEFGGVGYKQTVVVTEDKAEESPGSINGEPQPTNNVTVIKVSNKPPHTAIPVMGPETDIFDFSFHQTEPAFVNIVNTEYNGTAGNDYGTVFAKEPEYGHVSHSTTVSVTKSDVSASATDAEHSSVNVTSGSLTAVRLTGANGEADVGIATATQSVPIDNTIDANSVYERLCLASTSSEQPVSRLKNLDRNRKSSLPNLDIKTESPYECLFPNQSNIRNTTVTVNVETNGHVEHNSSETTSNVVASNVVSSNVVSSNVVSSNEVPSNLNSSVRALRSNVERSHSQNACDVSRAREHVLRRVQHQSPRRENRSDKESIQAKPIWKRGLTELSLLTRLRGIGQVKRQESPTRQDSEATERTLPTTVKVVHRSRPEGRADGARRRSSSLSNGQSPPAACGALVPLRRRQALALQADQKRRAALPAAVPVHNPPVLVEYEKKVWIAWWPVGGGRCNGRCGDRLAAVRGDQPRDLHHARQLIKSSPTPLVDILFHRVPLGKMYVLTKRDFESIGIKLDSECNIASVEPSSPAGRAGLPPKGKWAVTEVNNRPINLIKGGEEEMLRLSLHGTEVSVLLQPSPLVKKLRAAIKGNKALLSMR